MSFMKKQLKTAGRILMYTGLVGLAGLGVKGCNDFLNKPVEIPMRRTENQFYSDKLGSFLDYTFNDSGVGNNIYIADENGDGNADVLQNSGIARWIANKHKTKYFVREDLTKGLPQNNLVNF